MGDVNSEIAALIDGGSASPHSREGLVAETLAGGPDGPPSPHAEAETTVFDVDAINRDYALLLMGSRAVVVRERSDGPITDRVRFLTPEAFRLLYANKFEGKATWANLWFSHPRRRTYAGVEFFPNPDGAKGAPGYLNLYRGFEFEPSPEGKYDIFNDHLRTNVCNGDPELYQYVFGWFAHIVQRPRERIGTALVLRGPRGSGKTKVGEVFGSLFLAHYCLVDDPQRITGRFNSHMASCLLLQADEAVWAGDKTAEGRLKGLVTSEYQLIEVKGVDQVLSPNYVRLMMTSNEDWVVPAGKDERRFVVLNVDPRCAQHHEYFADMTDELDHGGRARLLYDLLHFDIAKVQLRQIPRTSALLEQKLSSMDSVEDWWKNRLDDGMLTHSEPWSEVMTKDELYNDYVREAEKVGIYRRKTKEAFGKTLKELVPGLQPVRPRGDGKRLQSYSIPPLEECRAAFEARLGQPIDWPRRRTTGRPPGRRRTPPAMMLSRFEPALRGHGGQGGRGPKNSGRCFTRDSSSIPDHYDHYDQVKCGAGFHGQGANFRALTTLASFFPWRTDMPMAVQTASRGGRIETDVRNAMLSVMGRCPDLTVEGLDGRLRPDFEGMRAALMEPRYLDAFEHARRWLSLVPWRVSPNRDCGSYRIKHVIERWSGVYTPNGICIAAAFDLGLPIARCPSGINAWLGVAGSRKWPASLTAGHNARATHG
jgi:hypothetical protein